MSVHNNDNRKEQPNWPLGPFNIRIPLLHYQLEKPEIIQGFVLFSIGLSVIPLLQNQVGMSYDAALAVVIVMQLTMILQTLLGSPFVPGLITPLIPLIVLFLGDFEPGAEAIQALVAVHLLVAVIFLLLGITGLGKILVMKLSHSLKAGILIGAGLAAFIGEFQPGGRVAETPLSLIIGGALCLFIMFSPTFKALYQKSKVARFIANYGIMPAILVAIAIGWLSGEYPAPVVEWGITIPNFVELWNYTPFVVGFPSVDVLLKAFPLAVMGYIIAYGDIIVGNSLIERAESKRKDEVINNDVTALHFITFLRNVIHGLVAPHPGLAGPIFTAGTASVAERYTYGKKAMQSIYSGISTLVLSLSFACFVLPLVTFFQPFLPIALSITLILTGYLCITLGMEQVDTNIGRGVAIIMAVVLAVYGAAQALVIGIVLYFVMEKAWVSNKDEDSKMGRKVG